MNRFDDCGKDLHTTVQSVQIALHRATDFLGQPCPVVAEQTVEGARGKIVNQDAAGGAANQRRYIGAVISRGECRLVVQTDAINEAHVHVDDLQALLRAAAAGDDLGFVIDVAGVPQTVGGQRRRAFSGFGLHGDWLVADTGCQFMDHAVFNGDHTPQWPRQPAMQTRAENLYRFTEALVDAATLQGNFMYAGQQPTAKGDHRQHWQQGPAHVTEGPDLAQIDAETVVHFML